VLIREKRKQHALLELPISFGFRKHKRHDLDNDVKKRVPSRGCQELCQVNFCRMMFVDIADTTVPNLIYVLKSEMLTT